MNLKGGKKIVVNVMEIKLTRKQISNLLTMLFVGSISFKDKKNRKIANKLYNLIIDEFERGVENA